MVGMTLREIECALYRKQFPLLVGDIAGPTVCDECLEFLWEFDGDLLVNYYRLEVDSFVCRMKFD